MSRVFAIALRCLLAASLLLGGAGVHATAPTAKVEAATPPCHGAAAIDIDTTTPDSSDHCGTGCRCACMALPMLMPVALILPLPGLAIPAAPPGLLSWHSTTVLPSLRPPIA